MDRIPSWVLYILLFLAICLMGIAFAQMVHWAATVGGGCAT